MSWIDGHRSKIELKRTPLQYIEKYEKNKEPQSAKNKIEQKMHHIGSSHFQCKTIISYLCSYDKKKKNFSFSSFIEQKIRENETVKDNNNNMRKKCCMSITSSTSIPIDSSRV